MTTKNNTINISKQNSRFNIIVENNKNNNTTNNNKTNNNKTNNNKQLNTRTDNNTSNGNKPIYKNEHKNNMFTSANYKYDDDHEEQYMNENMYDIDIMNKPEINLGLDNFPELGNTIQTIENFDQNKKYIEKLRQQQKNNKQIIDKDLVDLKHGWVLLKRNNNAGITIFKSHPIMNNHANITTKEENTERELISNVFNQLVYNHELNTQEYIDNWGYDEWEQTFKFNNWGEEESLWDEDNISDDEKSVCSDDYIDDY